MKQKYTIVVTIRKDQAARSVNSIILFTKRRIAKFVKNGKLYSQSIIIFEFIQLLFLNSYSLYQPKTICANNQQQWQNSLRCTYIYSQEDQQQLIKKSSNFNFEINKDKKTLRLAQEAQQQCQNSFYLSSYESLICKNCPEGCKFCQFQSSQFACTECDQGVARQQMLEIFFFNIKLYLLWLEKQCYFLLKLFKFIIRIVTNTLRRFKELYFL
ncbi:hypothetical protein ABPG72_014061 [Tetrahymena utriculariae]